MATATATTTALAVSLGMAFALSACGGGGSSTGAGGGAGTGMTGVAGAAAGTGGSPAGAAGAGSGGATSGVGGAPTGTGGASAGMGGGAGTGRGGAGAGTGGGAGAGTGGGAGAGTGGGAGTGTGGGAGRGGAGGAAGTSGGGSAGTGGGSAGTGAGAGGTSSGSAGTNGSRGGTGGGAGAAGTGGTGTATDFWVGPTGFDTNPGSEAMPFRTLTQAHARAMPGSTIWILPGTNQLTSTNVLSKSGTAAAPIRILPAAGAGRPVIDFSGQADADAARGIDVRGDYWIIRGLEVRNAGDNCVAVSGSRNLFQDLIIHGCADTGLQISATSAQAGDNTRAAYNQVINCDSYENLDQATNGENADGFAAKLRIGPGNVFRGCRAWNNADDGWDLFASDDIVTIEGCWAFLNGRTVTGTNSAGDGNGFKLGGAPNGEGQGGAVHLVTSSYAFDNRTCGFVRNNNPEVPKLMNCGADGNGTDYCSLTSTPAVSITMTGAQGKAAVRNADGSLPAIR